ncbi:MAG: hypothetical protein U0Y82_13750 [Thermoleophilia bacterium]
MLGEVAGALTGRGVRWALTGSAAAALLGATRPPRDLDLEVAVADMAEAAEALGMQFVLQDDGVIAGHRAVAVRGGVEVDISAGVTVTGMHGRLTPDDGALTTAARTVMVDGVPIPCRAPEESLARALVAGDWARVAKIAARGGPPPRAGYLASRLASIARR